MIQYAACLIILFHVVPLMLHAQSIIQSTIKHVAYIPNMLLDTRTLFYPLLGSITDVLRMMTHFLKTFFLTFIYFTSLRKQDEAYISSSQWSMLVGFELTYTRM